MFNPATPRWPTRLWVLALLLPMLDVAAGSVQRILELDLSQSGVGYSIVDLAFSPDGQKIAVTIYAGSGKTHLLMVDVQSAAIFRQFDFDTCARFLTWAPDGGALLVCGRVVRLIEGSSCDLSGTQPEWPEFRNRIFWLTADRLIRDDRKIFDLSCQPAGVWAIPGTWTVAGTVPENGWILLRQWTDRVLKNGRRFRFTDYSIADRDSHSLISGMLLRNAYRDSNGILAQGPAVFCSELVPADGYKITLSCWKLPSGEVFKIASQLRSYRVVESAQSSPRVIAERWGYRALDLSKEAQGLLRVIVVDLISGRQIASLEPHTQRAYFSIQGDQSFQYALAPGGDVIAEGGDGFLRLYRLP